MVRFARLMQRRVRAAFGGNPKPALVATQGGTGDGPGLIAFMPDDSLFGLVT